MFFLETNKQSNIEKYLVFPYPEYFVYHFECYHFISNIIININADIATYTYI